MIGIDMGVIVVPDLYISRGRIIVIAKNTIAEITNDTALSQTRWRSSEGHGGGFGSLLRRSIGRSGVGAGADDQADVVPLDGAIAIEIAVEPAVGSAAGSVVSEADDDSDVVARGEAVEGQISP